jgi:hypothetical protein
MENMSLRDRQPSVEPSQFPQLLVGLAIFSVALVVSSWMAAGAIRHLKRADDALVVTGSAKRAIRSDYIIWRISVSSQQPTSQAAYQQLKGWIDRVESYLKQAKIPAEAITLNALETSTIPEVINGRETGKTLAYRLNQRFEIRSNEVDRLSKLAQQVNELINEGVPLVSEPPEYLYTQLGKVRIEMVAEATKDAKARANAIAQSTGDRVGAVRSASTGVFQITPRYSTAVSDSGISDTSSIDKDITAVVSVKFGMD